MSGWGALVAFLGMFIAFGGGILFGAVWVRDDIAAHERVAAEAERRKRVLPLTYQPSMCQQRHGLRVVEGGRR